MRDILKAATKIGFGTLAGLLASVITGKVLALELGAAGIGLYGVLRQLLQTLTMVGTFNGQSALVQGIARRTTEIEQVRFSGSVFCLQMAMATTVALILLICAPWLGPMLIPHLQAVAMLRWIAVAMLVSVANLYIIGLLNGYRLVDSIVKYQVYGVIATLLLVYPSVLLIRNGHTFGFLLMLVGSAAFITITASRFLRRLGHLPKIRDLAVRRNDATQFMGMSTALSIAGIVATGAQFAQSWIVAKWMGLEHAGQFWAAWTLSMSYLTLVLGAMGTYYLPSLSRITDSENRNELIRTYLKLVLMFVPLLVSIVILLKPWVIQLMFSSAMLPSLDIMRWMLIGDYFKAISYVMAYPMLAFNDMKWFLWSDIVFSLGMVGANFGWIASGGNMEGLGMIFMFAYISFLVVAISYMKIKNGFNVSYNEIVWFSSGLVLVILVSVSTWDSTAVSMKDLAYFLLFLVIYAAISLRNFDWRSFKLFSRK